MADDTNFFTSPKDLKYLPALLVETRDVLSKVIVIGKATMKTIYLDEARED